MPTHRSTASTINLLDEVNEQAPQPVEAKGVPGNAMDDVVLRIIAKVEQSWRTVLQRRGSRKATQRREAAARRTT